MIRKYHRLTGKLTENVASDSTVIAVNAAMAAAIADTFVNGSDVAFFALSTPSAYEVVRVYGIDGNLLSVIRGEDGTTAQAFPIGATVAYVVSATGVIMEFLELGGGSSNGNVVITGSGLANVSEDDPGVFNVNVQPPSIDGVAGIEVIGAWPNLQIAYAGGECCGGGGDGYSGGGSSDIGVQTSGIISGSYYAGTLYLGVPEPQFYGNGIEITGSWPYLSFSLAPGTGQGSVTSVSVGAGLTLTGNKFVNPTLSITNTGVSAGVYGDIEFNSRGQVVNVAPDFNPVSEILSSDGTVTLTRLGGTYNIDITPAAIGVPGVVALADETDDFDPADNTNAATPAVIAKALQSFAIPELAGAGTYASEADGSYTNTLGGSATALELAAGEKALITANATARVLADPTQVVSYGLAVFNATPAKVQGNAIIPQNQQTLQFIMEGPFNGALSIVTTALPGGTSVTGYNLAVVKF